MQAGWSWSKIVSGVICRSSEKEMKGLQEGSESSCVVLFGDGGTDQKTGDRCGGGRVKDVEILFGDDEDGQD